MPEPNTGRLTLREMRAAAGSLGGRASSAKLNMDQRMARASMGGNALLHYHGIGYFAAIGSLSAEKKRSGRR